MKDESRWYLLTKKRIEDRITSAFRVFRYSGIEPILIKGWAAARNYPEGTPRFYGDIDLAVGADDFELARELTNDPTSGVIGVDLHRELRHLDTLSWDTILANSKLVNLEDEQIRILSAEDHLRVLCVHWLTDGGANRERLWDIVYAVRYRPPDFDWKNCLDVVNENRRGWIIATIGLANKYMELEIDDLPFADEARSLPRWFTRCVEKEWASGEEHWPLWASLKNPARFLRQVRKRIPPNPIQATINCEGPINEDGRIRYQLLDTVGRLGPSIRRTIPAILGRHRG